MIRIESARPGSRFLFCFTLLICGVIKSTSVLAGVTEAAANEKRAMETLRIGMSQAIPPWVITDSNEGIELDILVQALGEEHFVVNPVYLPFARALRMFQAGELDGVVNVSPDIKTGYVSDGVVQFENVAVSLRKNGWSPDMAIDQLKDKSVIAFQKARYFLGEQFHDMAAGNPDYREMAKQNIQVAMLFFERTEFVVLERRIFEYFRLQERKKQVAEHRVLFDQPVTYHKLFNKTSHRFVFKSETLRDRFNLGLRSLRLDGRYDRILRKYEKKQ